MLNKRRAGQFITKEAPAYRAGEASTFATKFRPATTEELRKNLDVTDSNSLPEGYIAGWASTNHKDHAWDVVADGAFQESINEKGLEGPSGIKLLAQHRPDQPAGTIKKLEYREGGLWIEAQLNLNISYVRDLYEAAKMNGGLNFSVGFRLVDGGFEFVEKGEDSFWLITKGDLFEVSVVTFPCNDEARMTYIKNKDGDAPFTTLAEAEKALVASGFAKSRNEAQRFTRWVKSLSQPAEPKPEPVSASTMKSIDSITAKLAELRKALS